MKTTLDLNDEILRRAETQAAREGISLTRFVEEALCKRLMDDSRRDPVFTFNLKTVKGYAPPTVDLSDREELYDVLGGA